MKKINKLLRENLALLILLFVIGICTMFALIGRFSENGSITLDGKDADIKPYTEKFIETSNEAMYRLMEVDAPTDEDTIKLNSEPEGLGSITTLEQVLARRLPDGNNDNGKGWQCSKYTAYLATGKREYSSSHPDYGPVNGKDMARYLVEKYGWKYIDEPVEGAIGSGGFNTLYGHTVMYLYSTGNNTAMVNDANYTPLKVSTHNMNISDYVWVVPKDWEPPVIPKSPDTSIVKE